MHFVHRNSEQTDQGCGRPHVGSKVGNAVSTLAKFHPWKAMCRTTAVGPSSWQPCHRGNLHLQPRVVQGPVSNDPADDDNILAIFVEPLPCQTSYEPRGQSPPPKSFKWCFPLEVASKDHPGFRPTSQLQSALWSQNCLTKQERTNFEVHVHSRKSHKLERGALRTAPVGLPVTSCPPFRSWDGCADAVCLKLLRSSKTLPSCRWRCSAPLRTGNNAAEQRSTGGHDADLG